MGKKDPGNRSPARGARGSDSKCVWPSFVRRLQDYFEPGRSIWLVGGVVRDALLGRAGHDVDLVVPEGGVELARGLALALDGGFVALDPVRGCGRAVVDWEGERFDVDITDFRAPTLEEDLRARDFTLNAMAVPLANLETLIDPLDGRRDLTEGRIRLASPHVAREDPLRVLRAIRFAADLGFELQPTDGPALEAAAGHLPEVAGERIAAELFRAFAGPRPGVAVRELARLGLLRQLLPEVGSATEARRRVERIEGLLRRLDSSKGALSPLAAARSRLRAFLEDEVAAGRSGRALLILAGLFSQGADLALRPVRRRLETLRCSNAEIRRVVGTLAAREGAVSLGSDRSRLALYRFFRDAGGAGVAAILLAIAEAQGDSLSMRRLAEALAESWRNASEIIDPRPLLDGRDLLVELKLEPGPRLGRLLSRLIEAQVEGRVATRGQALRMARMLEAAGAADPGDKTG